MPTTKKPEEYISRSELIELFKDAGQSNVEESVNALFMAVALKRILKSFLGETK